MHRNSPLTSQGPGTDYGEDLLEDLKNPRYADKYLAAAMRDSRDGLRVALRDVAEAQRRPDRPRKRTLWLS